MRSQPCLGPLLLREGPSPYPRLKGGFATDQDSLKLNPWKAGLKMFSSLKSLGNPG